MSLGVIGVSGVLSFLDLFRLILASKRYNILTNRIALIKILVRCSHHCLLVETIGLGTLVLLLFVVGLLHSRGEGNGGTLNCDFVILSLHQFVDALVLGYIGLLAIRCVLEAADGVMEILGGTVHRLLLIKIDFRISFLSVLSNRGFHVSKVQLRTFVVLRNYFTRLVRVFDGCDLLPDIFIINPLLGFVLK